MAEHYTKSTVEVKAWCAACRAFTMHHVSGGRKGSCKSCIMRLENLPKQAPQAKQESLF